MAGQHQILTERLECLVNIHKLLGCLLQGYRRGFTKGISSASTQDVRRLRHPGVVQSLGGMLKLETGYGPLCALLGDEAPVRKGAVLGGAGSCIGLSLGADSFDDSLSGRGTCRWLWLAGEAQKCSQHARRRGDVRHLRMRRKEISALSKRERKQGRSAGIEVETSDR